MAGKAKVLTSNDVKLVLGTLKNARDKTLFLFGLYTGLRISEIIETSQKQVYTKQGTVRNTLKVVRLKKKNTVYSDIPIHPKLRERLTSYSMELEEIDSPWLFPSTDDPDTHIGRVRAHLILSGAFDRANIEGASTHSMRRSCLTLMSRAGIPLRTIQEISGHANLGQLQEYLSVDPADTHKAIMSLKY